MRGSLWLSGFTVLAVALAGCTGTFDVQQTEPIRVQIDGESEEARVSSDDGTGTADAAERQEFVIEKEADVEVVKVMVEVRGVPAGEEPEPGEEEPPTGPTNATTNETQPGGTGEVAVILVIVEDRDTQEKLAEEQVESSGEASQIQLDVDVRGRNNVVVVTQAVQGTADVMVGAAKGEVGPGGAEVTATATATNTTTNATTPP